MLTKCKKLVKYQFVFGKKNFFQNKLSRNELKYDLDLTKLKSPDKDTCNDGTLKKIFVISLPTGA
jgi:hypothetical protein